MKAFLLNQSSFLFCVLFQLFSGVALITSSIYHSCVVTQKEFSRKVEMSSVESFYLNKLINKSFSFELEQFFILCFVSAVQGVPLITSSIYHHCVTRRKEFSRRIEMRKVESFYWNKLSNKSFSLESGQFFDLCFVSAVQGGCTDNIQYIPFLCSKTKGIFQES